MSDTFVLRIELGNDEMQTPEHVAQALRKAADALEATHGHTYGTVRDANGNTVGSWEIQ